jgi:hypothetical protein
LNGLEASIVNLSSLERTKRIDAEFFSKKDLAVAATLAAKRTDRLTPETCAVSDGNHFSISEHFSEDGVPYYRGQDVAGHFFIEQSNPLCITPRAFAEDHMQRSHLQQGDVLLSIVGTIGELSLVTDVTRQRSYRAKLKAAHAGRRASF